MLPVPERLDERTYAVAGCGWYFYLAYCAATFAEIMRKSPYVNPNAIGQIEDCVRRVSEELVLNDQVKDLLKSIQAYEKLMVKDK